MLSSRTQLLLLISISIGMFYFFCEKPVHLDETNFLALTTATFLGPHSVSINWQGILEPAFDVLSNPPGIAWFLWPVRDAEIMWQRLWVFPWSLLALWGSWRFGEELIGKGFSVALCVLSTPFFWLSSGSLMPDMPLFACIALGISGVFSGKNLHFWAFVAGCSALFRYSGMTMIPLIIAWGMRHQSRREQITLALAVSSPTILLFVHDIALYGQWHFAHMLSFQSEQNSLDGSLHKLGACMAMLAGGFVFPLAKAFWRRKAVLISIVITMVLSLNYGFSEINDIWHCIFILMGFVLFLNSVWFFFKRGDVTLFLWCTGGLLFFLNLRFAATRYWAPFCLPFILVVVTWSSKRILQLSVGSFWIIGFFLAWDDFGLAKTQKRLAERISNEYAPGYISGHWGWQYYMEKNKWQEVNEDSIIPNGVWFASSIRSWPQSVANECWDKNILLSPEEKPLMLRIHSVNGRVNYHSFMISNDPPIRSYAPWGFGSDAWDQIWVRRACSR